MKEKFIKFIVSISVVFTTTILTVSASQLSLVSETDMLQKGVATRFSILLNTEGEVVNATEGNVFIDPNCWEFKELNFTNSSIVLWVEQPKFENNNIRYAGITPGGFSGSELKVLSFVAVPKSKSNCNFTLVNPKVLLNDGNGTEAKLTITSTSFIANETGLNVATNYDDRISPENFEVILTSDSVIYDNKYFIVFNSLDKDSGIDYYEVSETNTSDPTKLSDWKRATSPYLLENQSLDKYVHVKAVDKKGNYKYSTVKPTTGNRNFSPQQITIFIFIIAIIFALTVFFLRKIKK